ncbi:hypothetical protein [Carbonactinospora thermoautotrophica]|uniref:hypothetical protein n=1 Tax=Carbonactinospora thermoautotrophica TaxID=1469144 RepID=UPI000B2BEE0F|nr:hypothetical protein [Carbonactinospora thermoautotrophica]
MIATRTHTDQQAHGTAQAQTPVHPVNDHFGTRVFLSGGCHVQAARQFARDVLTRWGLVELTAVAQGYWLANSPPTPNSTPEASTW